MNIMHLIGQRVVVVADMGIPRHLDGTAQFLFDARRIGAVGVVQFEMRRIVGGLLVAHEDGTKAIYSRDELELFSEQVLAFAQLKASRVQVLEAKLKAIKEATELP